MCGGAHLSSLLAFCFIKLQGLSPDHVRALQSRSRSLSLLSLELSLGLSNSLELSRTLSLCAVLHDLVPKIYDHQSRTAAALESTKQAILQQRALPRTTATVELAPTAVGEHTAGANSHDVAAALRGAHAARMTASHQVLSAQTSSIFPESSITQSKRKPWRTTCRGRSYRRRVQPNPQLCSDDEEAMEDDDDGMWTDTALTTYEDVRERRKS
jgi:hypothetical protein